MKKFAYLFAALSLCACTFTGCSDDDNKSDDAAKAQVNESCEKSDDCADGLVCNDDNKCEKKADNDDKANPCEGKAENDSCGDNMICDKDLKCVAKSNDGGDADEACKDKKAGDDCGEGKACDDNLKCIDKPADGGDEINCDKLPAVAESVKELAKVDEKDCKKLDEAGTNLFTALLLDKVISDKDDAKVVEAKSIAVLQKCAAGWGVDDARREALNAAQDKCDAEAGGDKKINCDDYAKVKAAVEAAAKVDVEKCDDVKKAFEDVDKAFEEDQVAEADQEAVLAACAVGWGMDEAKQTAINGAFEKCAKEAGGDE